MWKRMTIIENNFLSGRGSKNDKSFSYESAIFALLPLALPSINQFSHGIVVLEEYKIEYG